MIKNGLDDTLLRKHSRPLGPETFAMLMEDLPHIMDAIARGDEYCEMYFDWEDFRIVCRLAHEVAASRAQNVNQRHASIRAKRIAQGNYTEDEYFDA